MAEYIERETAYERLMNNKKWAHSPSDMQYAAELVLTVPAADVVEVRHGEWISGYDTVCSVCKIDVDVYNAERFNYCPNCGAKMDGKGEGE
jgi:hypothetical protein